MAAEKERLRRWREHDFYAALGIRPEATAADVKRGFRRVALTCHPDKVREEEREQATKRFQLIAEAYEVLSDENLRQRYDAEHRGRGVSAGGAARAVRVSKPNPAPKSGYPSGAHRRDANLLRCEGCDRQRPHSSMRKCLQCEKLICMSCKLCAGCIPEDQSPSPTARPEKPPEMRKPSPPPEMPKPAPQMQSEEKKAASAKPSVAPQEVWVRKNGKWDVPDIPKQDEEKDAGPMDSMSILLTMGFKEKDARAAVEESSTLEDAVQYLMGKARLAGEAGAAAGAATAVAASVLGEWGGAFGQRLSSWWAAEGSPAETPENDDAFLQRWQKTMVQPQAAPTERFPPGCFVEYQSRSTQQWIKCKVISFDESTNTYCLDIQPQAAVERVRADQSGETASQEDKEELLRQLLALGFSESQAKPALKKCSSIEVAVDWILAHQKAT